MKRVGCLYRVSTKRQVYNNDIPVQRNACKNFIKSKINWVLEKEYIELGVSGYKLSNQKRDVLQEIKTDVLNDKIDILLVFLFDRIGRRENETPLVVKWLIDKGVEVWSVNEGQRKIEDRYDRLMNFITYWQAEGESEKISLRATERRVQLTKEGVYMGNYAPYGYELINSDTYTKIGKIRKILKIYPSESIIIKKIFDLIVDNNYGTDKVAMYLNKKEIKRRKQGLKWDSNIILDIVRNPIYKGYVSFGKRYKRENWVLADKPNLNIIIIPEDKWNKANEIIDSRSRKGKRIIRLLSGLTRCGYCKEYITPKGKEKWTYMLCKGKQRTGFCEYHANYRIDILEQIVANEIQNYLRRLKKVDLKEVIIDKVKYSNKNEDELLKVSKQIEITKIKIAELKSEVMETLISKNQELQEKISNNLKVQNEILNNLYMKKTRLESESTKLEKEISNFKECIPNWEKEFKKANLENKRIIINGLIDKIFLFNDKIEIYLKYPIKNFVIKVENNE